MYSSFSCRPLWNSKHHYCKNCTVEKKTNIDFGRYYIYIFNECLNCISWTKTREGRYWNRFSIDLFSKTVCKLIHLPFLWEYYSIWNSLNEWFLSVFPVDHVFECKSSLWCKSCWLTFSFWFFTIKTSWFEEMTDRLTVRKHNFYAQKFVPKISIVLRTYFSSMYWGPFADSSLKLKQICTMTSKETASFYWSLFGKEIAERGLKCWNAIS